MLTDKDITKLREVFPTKKDVRTIEELRREYAPMSEQSTRHERWIKLIAKKAGVSLPE